MSSEKYKTQKVIDNSEYLRDSKAVKRWLLIGNFADNTGQGYTLGLHKYCNFHKMTPEALIEEAEAETNLSPMRQNIVVRLAEFKNSISDLAVNTQNFNLTGVRSFYRNFYINIPTNPNKTSENGKTTLVKNDWRGFNKNVVRECLKHLNLRNRAILLTIVSSGMARNEIMNLKLDDIKDVDNQNITTVDLQRIKSGTNYRTFLSPEATQAIKSYLAERKARGEKYGVVDDNPYLFITLYDNHKKGGRKIFEKLTVDGFNSIFIRMTEKMGHEFQTDDGTFNMLRSHNFRKFFLSAMQNNGLPKWQCEHQMGHTLNSLDKAYFVAEKNKMKQNYIKHLDAISVETEIKEVSIEESEKFQKMQAEYTEMKSQMNNLDTLVNQKIAEILKERFEK